MKIGYLLSALLIVLVSISAIPAASAQTSWYFGAGAGEAESDDGLSELDDGSLISGSVDDSDTGTKFFAGFRFSEKVAVEVALVDLGETSIDATSNGSGFLFAAGPASAEVDVDGINIALVGIWPVGEKVDVIGKLGFFAWDADASASNSAFGSVSIDDDGTDPMFGVGGQFRVGKKVGIRVEFERFADVFDVDVDLLSVSIFFTGGEK